MTISHSLPAAVTALLLASAACSSKPACIDCGESDTATVPSGSEDDASAGGSGGAGAALDAPLDLSGAGGGVNEPDEPCAELTVSLEAKVSTVMLLIDRSGSMSWDFNGESRWDAVWQAMFDDQDGIVPPLASEVRFGMSLYDSVSSECLRLIDVKPDLNNASMMSDTFLKAGVGTSTPTGPALLAATATLLADASTGPKVIVLATDGDPKVTCDAFAPGTTPQQASVQAAQEAYALGVETYVVSIAVSASTEAHLTEVAKAGAGEPVDGVGGAEAYAADNQAQLVDQMHAVINGLRSCTYEVDGTIDVAQASQGEVLLDGQALAYDHDDGWTVISSTEIEIKGEACETLKQGTHTLSASFPCGVVTPN
ncbi:MAG: vWA domain-containing protein [Polyangiaceae bacterium]